MGVGGGRYSTEMLGEKMRMRRKKKMKRRPTCSSSAVVELLSLAVDIIAVVGLSLAGSAAE